jgi:hypothetical protein
MDMATTSVRQKKGMTPLFTCNVLQDLPNQFAIF